MPTERKLLIDPRTSEGRRSLILGGIILAILFLILLLFLIFRNRPEQEEDVQGATNPEPTNDTPTVESEPEYMELALKDLVEDNENDPNSVNESYTGKYIQTTGYVSTILINTGTRPSVQVVHTRNQIYVGTSIRCEPVNDISGISVDDEVLVKGKMREQLLGVINLDECHITKLRSSSQVTMQSTGLNDTQNSGYTKIDLNTFSKEFDSNRSEVFRKYEGKDIETIGFVVNKLSGSGVPTSISIAHTIDTIYTNTTITCHPTNEISNVKEKDLVRVRGKIRERLSSVVFLDNCIVERIASTPKAQRKQVIGIKSTSVTPVEISSTYRSEYMGKHIDSTGYIDTIIYGAGTRSSILVVNSINPLYAKESIQCFPNNDISDLRENDSVNIKGRIYDQLLGITKLEDCTVTKLNTEPQKTKYVPQPPVSGEYYDVNMEDYNDSSTNIYSKYAGNRIESYGYVSTILSNTGMPTLVSISNMPTAIYTRNNIQCFPRNDISNINKRDLVLMKGRVVGQISGITKLEECTVTKVSTNTNRRYYNPQTYCTKENWKNKNCTYNWYHHND